MHFDFAIKPEIREHAIPEDMLIPIASYTKWEIQNGSWQSHPVRQTIDNIRGNNVKITQSGGGNSTITNIEGNNITIIRNGNSATQETSILIPIATDGRFPTKKNYIHKDYILYFFIVFSTSLISAARGTPYYLLLSPLYAF